MGLWIIQKTGPNLSSHGTVSQDFGDIYVVFLIFLLSPLKTLLAMLYKGYLFVVFSPQSLGPCHQVAVCPVLSTW